MSDRIIRKLPPIRGIAQYPHLNTPDEYKGEVKYKLNLIVDPAEKSVQSYLATVETAMADVLAQTLALIPGLIEETKPGKQGEERRAELQARLDDGIPLAPIFEPQYDAEGEETGKIILKMKHPSCFTNRKGEIIPLRPKLFALVLNEMTGEGVAKELFPAQAPEIWGGSELIVNGDTRPYFVEKDVIIYPVLRVNGALIARLRTAGSNLTANDFGNIDDVEAIAAPESNSPNRDGYPEGTTPPLHVVEAAAAAGDENEDF